MIPAPEIIRRSDLHLDRAYRDVAFRTMPPLMVAILRDRAAGLTIWKTVFIHPDEWQRVELGFNPGLVAHELHHVDQWTSDTWRFLSRYVVQYLRFRLVGADHDAAYRAISYEMDARAFSIQSTRRHP
jgi:hypothetical protein